VHRSLWRALGSRGWSLYLLGRLRNSVCHIPPTCVVFRHCQKTDDSATEMNPALPIFWQESSSLQYSTCRMQSSSVFCTQHMGSTRRILCRCDSSQRRCAPVLIRQAGDARHRGSSREAARARHLEAVGSRGGGCRRHAGAQFDGQCQGEGGLIKGLSPDRPQSHVIGMQSIACPHTIRGLAPNTCKL
jgi:hypothetical protein